MSKEIPPVAVLWEDIHGESGWQDGEDFQQMLKSVFLVMSVGYIVAQSKGRIVLSHGYCLRDTQFMDYLVIPRANIKRIYQLVEKNAKKKPSTHQ